jgi:hypothetical protein
MFWFVPYISHPVWNFTYVAYSLTSSKPAKNTKGWYRCFWHTGGGVSDTPEGFQSGPVPGTFTRLRSCIVPVEITEPPKISSGQNHKYDGR